MAKGITPANDAGERTVDALVDAARVQIDAIRDAGLTDATALSPMREGPGMRIGPYKLLQQIGEGGFGVVFMAEQDKPVTRRVALKIIKLGMDTRQVVARFEAERQALAMMDHPNIARVFDAGATETGRPYFVMELVRGDPITEYCDTNNLSTRERLQLFTLVCNAVQHAHQKGVIHRDIKPTNILVGVADGSPIPKVIDFGIAKATASKLTEKTLFTEHRAMIGTPAYMSPEQAEMSAVDVDTRSDIYSLGVLLYELLTGTTPFDPQQLRSAAYGEIQRIIREVEPPRPSTRLSTLKDTMAKVAAHRHTEPAKLSALLRGDLDWIVMKAMEKDRTRRYETANGLASDVQRHLAGEPVLAVPPSPGYRLRKFARKHRAGLSAATAFILLLVGGVVLSTSLAMRASRAKDEEAKQRHFAEEQRDRAIKAEADAQSARKRADSEAASAKAVSDFLREDLLGQIGTDRQIERGFAPDPNLTIKTALNRAAARIGDKFPDQPLVEADIRLVIGQGFQELGEPRLALPNLEKSYALRKANLGPDNPQTLDVLNSVGVVHDILKDTPRAVEICETIFASRKAALGPDGKETLRATANLAILYSKVGRFDEAWALTERGIALAEAKFGPNNEFFLNFLRAQMAVRRNQDDYPAAVAIAKRHLELFRKESGEDNSEVIVAAMDTASFMSLSGDNVGAEALFTKTLKQARRVLGDDHPGTLAIVEQLGSLYQKSSPSKGVTLVEEFLPIARKMLGPKHPSTLRIMLSLAELYRTTATKVIERKKLCEEVYLARKEIFGADAGETREAQSRLALACVELKELDLARSLLEGLTRLCSDKLGDDHEDTLGARLDMARVHMRSGHPETARSIAEDVYSRIKNKNTRDIIGVRARALEMLRDSLREQGRDEEALPIAEEFVRTIHEFQGPDNVSASYGLGMLLDVLLKVKGPDEAIARAETELADYDKRLGVDHEVTEHFRAYVVSTYFSAGRAEKAIPMAEAQLIRARKRTGPTSDVTAVCLIRVGGLYLQANRREDFSRTVEELTALVRTQPDRYDYVKLMVHNSSWNQLAGRFVEAAAIMEEVVTKETARLGPDHPDVMQLKLVLAERYFAGGQFNRAVSLQRAHLAYSRKIEPADPVAVAADLALLGISLIELGDFEEAESLIRECLSIREAKMPDDWRTFNTKAMLGRAMLGQNNFAEAEPLLLAGYEGMKQREKPMNLRIKPRLREAAVALARLYESTGIPDKASQWKLEADLWKIAENSRQSK